MKFTTSLFLASSLATTTMACPGLKAMEELNSKIAAREVPGPNDSFEMIGDLATVGAKTSVGNTVKNILQGTTDPYSDAPYFNILWPKGSWFCNMDTCCIWKHIANEMASKFRGSSGRCNAYARAAVRLGFHDAGAWSKTSPYGGADGSFVLGNEITRPENAGLEEINQIMQGWYNTYHSYGASMADLIQMGATVATVVCPLGPRIRSFVGRKDNATPAPPDLLPSPFDKAENLIQLFQNKTIMPHGLTALLGAHTVSQQRFVDPSRSLDPQDSTPGVWDVKFYGQTLGIESTPPRVFKFPSDVVLSVHPKLNDEWLMFAGKGGQEHWNEDYAKEYVRLSLLGVNNINGLTECTKVLPPAIKFYVAPDQDLLNSWLGGAYGALGKLVEDATQITTGLLGLFGIHLRDVEGGEAGAKVAREFSA